MWSSRALVVAVAGAVGVLTVGLAVAAPVLLVPLVVAAAATAGLLRRTRGGGLQIDQIERLRQAEVALAEAPTTAAAAHQLADHAIALLDAPSALVLIEGIGDTVRVNAGDHAGTMVYGTGSRMRLLEDDGVPCGSIAVSARANGRPYGDLDERILDALAQRVSSTLHRLSLFADVQGERRTLEDVLASSSDGIFSVGSDHRIRSWNPAMARITGVDTAEAIGQQSHAVFRPTFEDGEPCYGQADPGRRGRTTDALLVSIRDDRGEHIWLTCSWSPLSTGGYVVVARDETERKKLQDDKDGWIAQVSHELRTPLTPLKGFLHTLARRDEQLEPDDRRKIYDVMLREQRRLEDLVHSLLQATSLDQELDMLVPEVIDWRKLVEEQVDLYARQDLSREIELKVAADVPAVVADPQLATGVLVNLLSNAWKYGELGGRIRVIVGVRESEVVTTVIDDGPGVPEADRERIFDKFTRLGDHLTRPQQGVGLGLYIARRSVLSLGGDIWVADAENGGAAFSFSLPAHTDDSSTANASGTRADEGSVDQGAPLGQLGQALGLGGLEQ